jgi:galactose mutarotase-like enzyme
VSEIVTLAARELKARVAPAAGMVVCSLRHRGDELLGQRDGLAAYIERGTTFGIPLLYPWANRLGALRYRAAGHDVDIDPGDPRVRRDPNGLPIHGLLAASPYWHLERRDGSSVVASLDYGAHRELLAAFPFPHRLELEAGVADGVLTVRTTVTPTADRAVPISFGFHPYLRLPGVPRSDWRVTLPAAQRLVLDERSLPTGAMEPFGALQDAPLGRRTFDDGFGELESHEFAVAGPGRRIVVRFLEGYAYAQVYAPADDDVICFEPMTSPTDALRTGDGLSVVRPGQSFSAAFCVAAESS